MRKKVVVNDGLNEKRLKKSIVTIEIQEGGDFAIHVIRFSGLLPEWLFVPKFCVKINVRFGIIFDWCEEDEAGEDVVKIISAELAKRIKGLNEGLNGNGGEIEFAHDWNANRTLGRYCCAGMG
ncbi:hypothetical protein [Burkholderia ubonensis]|uniref:hypothetical protein n=1 Tax=Burkholderia ubonensis TaxID=101571 RepID=UPI0015C3E307|nr:hypothetical protein [Burkholderia ubonensis]